MASHERIARVVPITGSDDRVALFAWSHEIDPRLHNVARVSATGEVVWRAALPGSSRPDCFVKIWRDQEAVVARTFSGAEVRLCPATGRRVADLSHAA